jgi:hypothetical protein
VLVEERLDYTLAGPILRQSHRQALLRAAVRLGLTRFDACLVIAAVQHRHSRPASTDGIAPVDLGEVRAVPVPNRRAVVLACAGLVAVVELALAAALWLVLSP